MTAAAGEAAVAPSDVLYDSATLKEVALAYIYRRLEQDPNYQSSYSQVAPTISSHLEKGITLDKRLLAPYADAVERVAYQCKWHYRLHLHANATNYREQVPTPVYTPNYSTNEHLELIDEVMQESALKIFSADKLHSGIDLKKILLYLVITAELTGECINHGVPLVYKRAFDKYLHYCEYQWHNWNGTINKWITANGGVKSILVLGEKINKAKGATHQIELKHFTRFDVPNVGKPIQVIQKTCKSCATTGTYTIGFQIPELRTKCQGCRMYICLSCDKFARSPAVIAKHVEGDHDTAKVN